MKDVCGIYKIENKINGLCYVGQSIHVHARWREHINISTFKNKKSYDYPLYQDFRQYGIENFDFSILEECKREELNQKEIFYITKYDAYNNGYNQTKGGQSPTTNKLTDKEVAEIYNLLANSSMTQNEIANKYNSSIATISTINSGLSYYCDEINYPIRINQHKYYCIDCGKSITSKDNLRCPNCYAISQRKVSNRPSADELKEILLKNNGSFTAVGRLFGVKDNTIRKWCKGYNMPTHTPDYQINKKPVKIPQPKTPCKSVAKIDIETDEIIEIYSSTYQAEKENGNNKHITAVCKGKRKTCNGFKWRYIEN